MYTFGRVLIGGVMTWIGVASPMVLASPMVIESAAYNGHTYSLLSAASWTESEAFAQSLGGHLVTINDSAEDAFIYGSFTRGGSRSLGLWIGLSDAEQEGTFLWASGEAVTYTNWDETTQYGGPEPNDDGGIEDYAVIFWPGDPRASRWNDAPDGLDPFGIAPFGITMHGVVEVNGVTVPEPPLYLLLACGCGLLVTMRRRAL